MFVVRQRDTTENSFKIVKENCENLDDVIETLSNLESKDVEEIHIVYYEKQRELEELKKVGLEELKKIGFNLL